MGNHDPDGILASRRYIRKYTQARARPTGAPMQINGTITVKKTDLVDKLNERIADVQAGYDASIAEIQKRESEAASLSAALTDYHIEVAKGLKKGRFRFTEAGTLQVVDKQTDSLPQKPTKATMKYEIENFGYKRVSFKQWLDATIQPLESAIEMLGLTQQEEIDVPVADYQALLNTRWSTRGY